MKKVHGTIHLIACNYAKYSQIKKNFTGRHTHTRLMSRYQKGKTNLDFTGARDSGWQWNLLGRMQVCTLHQTDNHASTPPLSFLQAGCPSCRPTNSVKALADSAIINLSSFGYWQSHHTLNM